MLSNAAARAQTVVSAFIIESPTVPSYTIAATRVDLSADLVVCPPRGGTALPVVVIAFQAKRLNTKTVKLEWDVADTPETYVWTLERSLESPADFGPVRAFTPPELFRRECTDANGYPGRSYYRMRGQGEDGNPIFTDTRVVNNNIAAEAPALFVTPNPSNDRVMVRLPDPGEGGQLDLHDARGQIVWKRSLTAGQVGDLEFSVRELPPGAYWLRYRSSETATITRRLLVQR